MQEQSTDHKAYLEKKLDSFRSRKVIDGYDVTKATGGYSKVNVTGQGFDVDLYTDFQSTMEITINGYYRDVTDYLIGVFQDTINWYLEILQNLAEKKYTVIEYSRGGVLIYKYLKMEVRGKSIMMGDFKNHFKLFAKHIETVAGNL